MAYSMARERLYLDHAELIEQVIAFICRRHRLPADEADELAGEVRLALVEDDYAILAAFEGRCKLSTYLHVVIQRLFFALRSRKWGRWRPSAEAQRLGPLAVRLERMISRDGSTFESAYQSLRCIDPDLTREAVADIAARLPPRNARRFEDEAALEALPSSEPTPDETALANEAAARRRRADAALHAAVAELPPQDQLVLRLRFIEGRKVVEIARGLALEPRPLYRRIEGLVGELRRRLEGRGVSAADFGWDSIRPALDSSPPVASQISTGREDGKVGPSTRMSP